MQQRGPRWGVMFQDGSVREHWNGNTMLFRALGELARLREQYPTDNITLAYRKGPGILWSRVGDRTQEV